MKKTLITAIAAFVAAVAAQAQGNITKAIDAFISNKDVIENLTLSSRVEEDKDGSGNKCKFYHYTFSLPTSKTKLFTPLRTAFMKDAPKAYSVYTKSAGTSSYNTERIAYGQNLERSIEFGAKSDHNYLLMLVRDPQDSLRRSVYALVWYDDKKKDTFNGDIFQIYSRAPRKVDSRKSKTYIVKSKKYGDIDLSGLDFDKKDLNLENLGAYLDGDGSVYNSTDKVSSGTEFLQRFGNFRAMYLRSIENDASLEYRTALVNRIVRFVEENKKVLSRDDKYVCYSGLKELKEKTKDKYLAHLFEKMEEDISR